MTYFKEQISEKFNNNIGLFKFIVATILLVAIGFFGSFTMRTLSGNDDSNFTAKHEQLDVKLNAAFDAWVAEESFRTFCMQKAKLITEEKEIRQKLGDNTDSLDDRYKKVSTTEACQKTIRTVLFK